MRARPGRAAPTRRGRCGAARATLPRGREGARTWMRVMFSWLIDLRSLSSRSSRVACARRRACPSQAADRHQGLHSRRGATSAFGQKRGATRLLHVPPARSGSSPRGALSQMSRRLICAWQWCVGASRNRQEWTTSSGRREVREHRPARSLSNAPDLLHSAVGALADWPEGNVLRHCQQRSSRKNSARPIPLSLSSFLGRGPTSANGWPLRVFSRGVPGFSCQPLTQTRPGGGGTREDQERRETLLRVRPLCSEPRPGRGQTADNGDSGVRHRAGVARRLPAERLQRRPAAPGGRASQHARLPRPLLPRRPRCHRRRVLLGAVPAAVLRIQFRLCGRAGELSRAAFESSAEAPAGLLPAEAGDLPGADSGRSVEPSILRSLGSARRHGRCRGLCRGRGRLRCAHGLVAACARAAS